jgi:hypothetical protein
MKSYALQALHQIEISAKSNIWDAHRGCAAIAGTLLLSQHLVSDDARPAVVANIRFTLEPNHDLPPVGTGIPREVFATGILQELANEADTPHEIGHDVIYSAYVLRAIDVFDIEPWDTLLESVITLIRKIKRSGPGWITVNGKNEVRPLADAAEDSDKFDCWEIFSQLNRPLLMEAGDMQLGHLLTHGHAIEMLRQRGSDSLVMDLELAYRKRLSTVQKANAEELDQTPLRRSPIDPRTEKYWAGVESLGHMHGHALKYAYSFLDLRKTAISATDLEAYGRIMWPAQPEASIPRSLHGR